MFASIQATAVASILTAATLGFSLAAPTPAPAAVMLSRPAPAYHFSNLRRGMSPDASLAFTTLDDPADPTFNQLLGINNNGLIVGYFGSGATGHPNQGYELPPPYNSYVNENFPGSVQTQVTAVNNRHDTAGFWVDANGKNRGFVEWNGVFTSYPNPHKSSVSQILGLNDYGIGVGFYVDGNGLAHGYEVNQATSQYKAVTPPSGSNTTASGINDNGDVVGFTTAGNGATVGFLMKDGKFSEFAFPNAMATTPFGVNSNDEIVGSFMDSAGATHGFTLTNPLTHAKFTQIDDPAGVGGTVVNGLNDKGELVGFYIDAAGNTDGMLVLK